MKQRRRGDAPSRGELELFETEPAPPRGRDRLHERPRDSRRAEPAEPRREPAADSYFVQGEIPGATQAAAVSVMALTRTAQAVLEGAFTPLWINSELTMPVGTAMIA